MEPFMAHLELEKRRLEKQVERAAQKLSLAPEGSLTIRSRKKGKTYYRNINTLKGSNRIRKQININLDPKLILQLTEKIIQKHVLSRAQHNLFYLNKLISQYQSTTPQAISTILGHQYQDVLQDRNRKFIQNQSTIQYPKMKYNPDYHVHETDCGEFVRSKSEQIILNTLSSYDQFVTHYEEEFLYRDGVEGLNRVYPDFTIILPDGRRILWEHLGRLDDPAYCERVVLKLCLYQRNGYVIGDNLILTMDDNQGNISSALVLQAIQHILAKM